MVQQHKKNKMNDRRHTYRVDVYTSILKYEMWFMQNTRTPKCVQHKVSRLFYRVLSLLCIAICFGYIPFHIIPFCSVPFRSVRLQFISMTFLDHTKWKMFCLSISFFVCASSFPSTLLEQTWVRCCGCETKLRLKKYISCQIKRKQSTRKIRTFSQWPQKYIN